MAFCATIAFVLSGFRNGIAVAAISYWHQSGIYTMFDIGFAMVPQNITGSRASRQLKYNSTVYFQIYATIASEIYRTNIPNVIR